MFQNLGIGMLNIRSLYSRDLGFDGFSHARYTGYVETDMTLYKDYKQVNISYLSRHYQHSNNTRVRWNL